MISKKDTYQEITGAIHLHTTYSDGGVTLKELIQAAKDVDLNFIIVTDHMTLGGLLDGYEGFSDKLCVMVGYEHHDPDQRNHYLALGVNEVFDHTLRPQDYIDAIRDSGGIGFLAHPAEKRNYFGNLPPYPWTAWEVSGYNGIEIWNQMSDWVENLKSWMSIFKLFYPRRFLGAPPAELLKKWDSLNQNCFISCIGGVDAHSRQLGIGYCSFRVFPIKVELKGVRTHLYIESKNDFSNFKKTKKNILNALQNGNGFVSNFRRGDARGSKFFLKNENGKINLPGIQKSYSLPAQLNVEIPEKGRITLLANGRIIDQVESSEAVFDIENTGVYRIEVYRKSKPWIYSNPFPVGPYPFQVQPQS